MSTPFAVTFIEPLAEHHADDLRRHVYYVSEDIREFRLIRNGSGVAGVELSLADPGRAEEVAAKVRRLVVDDIARRREVPNKVVWRLPERSHYATDTAERLRATRTATTTAPGLTAVSGAPLALMEYFDGRFRNMARENGAAEVRYPTLIPTEVIDRCGYIESFPQLMMFATRLRGDIDNYRAFTDRHASGGDVASYVLEHAGPADYCLPPATCFHVYHQHEGMRLPEGRTAVTAAAKVFRHESKYEDGLERLWDFTMREIVFIGDRNYVRDRRRALMETVREFLAEHGMSGHCEVANDPFFVGADFAAKMTLQSLSESKYELRLGVEPNRTIACGSFNYHDSFFTSRFDIGAPGEGELTTGCVAFGLERFAYAFMCQHGVDPAGWPEVMAGLPW
jgi:seryl-tRNA synthetase